MKDLNSQYRPKEWADVKGQDRTTTILSKQVESKSGLSNSYILSGKSGIGKTTLARLFFSKLNKGGINDLMEVNASDTRGIDDMRELIKETRFVPVGDYRGIILDECHMLSAPAWNCLLKPIEESKNTIWLFCTTVISKIPKTIQTRCQTFVLNPIKWSDIYARLAEIVDIEKMSISEEELWTIARNSDTNLRQAIHILEQYSVVGDIDKIIKDSINIDFLEALGKVDSNAVYNVFMSWRDSYDNIDAFLNRLKYDITTVLTIKLGLKRGYISSKRLEYYKTVEPRISEAKLMAMLSLLLEMQEKTSGIWDYNSMFLNILCQFKNKYE